MKWLESYLVSIAGLHEACIWAELYRIKEPTRDNYTTYQRGRSRGVGVRTPWKYAGWVTVCFEPTKSVTFFHSILLYNYKFHNIKDEQLDTISSLILLMLTMLPSLCLISSKQTVSSNKCLCCYTGLKVIVTQDITPKRGCRWPAVDNHHRWYV